MKSDYRDIYESHSNFRSNPFMQSKMSSSSNNTNKDVNPASGKSNDTTPSPNKVRRRNNNNDGHIDTPPGYRSNPMIPDTPTTPMTDDDGVDEDEHDDYDEVVGVWCVKLETALSTLNDFCCSLPLNNDGNDVSIDSTNSASTPTGTEALSALSMCVSRSISLAEEYLSLLCRSSSSEMMGVQKRKMGKQMERTLRCSARYLASERAVRTKLRTPAGAPWDPSNTP